MEEKHPRRRLTDSLLTIDEELTMEEKVHLSWTALFGGFDRTSGTRTDGLVQWQKSQMDIQAKTVKTLSRIGWGIGGVLFLGVGNAMVLWLGKVLEYISKTSTGTTH